MSSRRNYDFSLALLRDVIESSVRRRIENMSLRSTRWRTNCTKKVEARISTDEHRRGASVVRGHSDQNAGMAVLKKATVRLRLSFEEEHFQWERSTTALPMLMV